MAKSTSRNAKRTTQPIPESSSINIPLNKLRLSEKNVRTIYNEEGINELAESIAQHGLIQSLSVRPMVGPEQHDTGQFEVQAGGRRFRALNLLLTQKRIASDKPIPCVLKTDGFSEDDSYVENSQREALHPLDEFAAFKAMKALGKSESEIAVAHRVTPAFVRQRLRLADASPILLEAFRNEELTLEQLMSYCISPDHPRQESVYERLKGDWNHTPSAIKHALTEGHVKSTDPRALFVGLEAYEAAGGYIERDLFSSNGNGYLQDAELLNRLADEKLKAHVDGYLAKGWKWVEAAVDFPYSVKMGLDRLFGETTALTAKQQKRLEKLTELVDELDSLDELTDEQDHHRDTLQAEIDEIEDQPQVFAKDDMAKAGVFISLDRDGKLYIEAGFIKPDDASSADDSSTASNAAISPAEVTSEEPDDTPKPLSASLIEDLTAYRTVALRNALGQDFDIAFIAVVHALALSRFYAFKEHTSLQLKLETMFAAKADGLDQWPATKALNSRDLAWKKQLPQNADELWDALLAMDATTRQGLFAHLASLSINAVQTAHYRRDGALRHANQLATALGTDMLRAGWATTADNYFSRVSKDRILQAVTEARGTETASLIAHLKKEPMVTEAERLVKDTGWLPEQLRNTNDAPLAVQPNDPITLDVEEASDLPDFLISDTDVADPAVA